MADRCINILIKKFLLQKMPLFFPSHFLSMYVLNIPEWTQFTLIMKFSPLSHIFCLETV